MIWNCVSLDEAVPCDHIYHNYLIFLSFIRGVIIKIFFCTTFQQEAQKARLCKTFLTVCGLIRVLKENKIDTKKHFPIV